MDNSSGFFTSGGNDISSISSQQSQGNGFFTSGGNAIGTTTPQSDNGFLTSGGNPTDIPIDVRDAKEVTGQHDLDGFCETAVEQWAGLPKMGGTAGEAWNNWVSQGKASPGLQGAQPGDLLYFQPNSGNANSGHAALFEGYQNGKPIMISATYQGVREDDVNNWSSNIAPLLGYVHPQ